MINFRCLSHPVCGTLLRQPWETNNGLKADCNLLRPLVPIIHLESWFYRWLDVSQGDVGPHRMRVLQCSLMLTEWEMHGWEQCLLEGWRDGIRPRGRRLRVPASIPPSAISLPSIDWRCWNLTSLHLLPFPAGQGASSQNVDIFGFIFSKCFLHGTLLRVPSWPPICTTQLGEVAKKSELLECSGPRNITLRGSLVLARMSL